MVRQLKISKLLHKVSNDQMYNELVKEIINHDEVQRMNEYSHHANITLYHHSLHVSYTSYRMSKFLGLNYMASARGGLLHDFFHYDWHEAKEQREEKGLHAFAHPKVALRNASHHFLISDLEADIIVKHMWPLSAKPPVHRESMLVSCVDKYCAVSEAYQSYYSKIKRIVKMKFS